MKESKTIDVYHKRVRKAIAESGLNNKQIAELMNCERKILSNTRTCMMSSYNLARFCAVTHVSADYILGLSDEQRIIPPAV